MVRETRHLWVGNLPDNIREDRIREHFKRYGRVQNVKLLGRTDNVTTAVVAGGTSGVCATVAFMDIKSASKAHNAEHVLDERTLTTEYYEPAAIPSATGAPSAGSSPAGSGYSGSSSSVNSTPAPTSVSRYHLSGGEDSSSNTCPIAASAAAPATWRGTNDSATEFCRRGNTPAAYGRYQRNNSTAPYSTPPSNVERTTPHHRWYAGDRVAGATGGESTPSTPGGGTEGGRRRRHSGSGSSRSDSSSPEPSDTSRASTPATQPPHHNNHRTQPTLQHQWASTASGRPLAICVRNLPTRSTDSSLKDGLYHEYKKHGKVVWVKVVGQNADRYAVVRFKKPSDVEKALEVSQDKLFFGCKISVAPHQSCDEDADSAKPYETDIDEYHPKATRTLFIGNLEKDVTQQQLRDKFKHFGRIIEIDIKKGSSGGAGYAFCQYASISSVVEAIRAMDGEYVGGSRVKLGFGKPVATTCVWVDGLAEHTEKQVLSAVSRCGGATSVCVDRAAGAALVHFEQAAAAGAAVRELRRVAAAVSATEPDHPRLCVDYASRECQEAFYEQLEKHGGTAALTGSERLTGELATTRYMPSTRHEPIRYDTCTSRSRASSYGRSSSRTPRYSTLDHYDPTDYAADRRYRVYDEVGSSPQPEDTAYEERLQSVVVSPHRARRHRRDSSPEDRKHSKERHRSAGARRSRSGSRGGERHGLRRKHRRRRDGSGSHSRAGTPLRDELDAPPTEPRRIPRERPPLPMSLPLPKFAVQLLRTVPPAPRPAPAPAPDSPPRPPSISSSSGGSAPHSPSLEERIRSLDEKLNGSRTLTDAPDRTRLRHRLLEIDINEVKPSEVVRSLLAKRSVFDEDSERLEGAARVPSPVGSPRASSQPCTPRALRYPFPAHPPPPPPPPPSTPPDEPRVCPRTPDTTDREQSDVQSGFEQESNEKQCDKRSVEDFSGHTESINFVMADVKKKGVGIDEETGSRDKIGNYFNNSINIRTQTECTENKFSTPNVTVVKDEMFRPNDRCLDPLVFHPEDSTARDVMDMLLKQVENYHEAQKHEFDSHLDKKIKSFKDHEIKSEFTKQEFKVRSNSESKFELLSQTDSKDTIESNIAKELIEYEMQQNHVNSMFKSNLETSQNILNDTESSLKDKHNYHPVKLEKENIIFDKTFIKEKFTLPMGKKTADSDKNHEERSRTERDKMKQIRERIEKDKHEHDNSLSKPKSKFEKHLDKDKKVKEDIDKIQHDKVDKIKIEKDSEKINKDKIDKDVEKTKHIEEKSAKHEFHKKDKNEKDKRIDLLDIDSVLHKTKKDDKHKYERSKKDNDFKKEMKKDSESIKHRKSSRDESARELCRKDSTDSSTSRTSHDSSKVKETDNSDNKEEIKLKSRHSHLIPKHENEKNLISTVVKTEIKDEKDPVPYIKNKVDIIQEQNLKPKGDTTEKQRHYSLDSPSVDTKRKERLSSCSSLPSNIGYKRRMSSQDSLDSFNDDAKKCRNDTKISDRRDSKDSRTEIRHKTAKFSKGHFAKIIESKTKDDKKNQVKPPDDTYADAKENERSDYKDLKNNDKTKLLKKSPKEEVDVKYNVDTSSEGLRNDLDFLATLELRSSEEDERQRALRKEMKEKKRIQQLQQIQELQMQQDALQQAEFIGKNKDDKKQKCDDKKKETAREKRMSTDRKSRDEKMEHNKRKNRKLVHSSDSSDSDEPKKHSIFDIIDDGPTYISMYDKVKARSCKNMQKQEEEKRQEKIKAKFSQLKQSRAKREEKKRSSWDEDSDSDPERKKHQKSSMDNSSDDDNMILHTKKRDKMHVLDFEHSKMDDFFDVSTNEEDPRNKLSRKNSRTRIMSDSSDDAISKRSLSKSPNFLDDVKKELHSDLESMQLLKSNVIKDVENNGKKSSILNLFGKSDSDDNKMKLSLGNDNGFKSNFVKSLSHDFSSENESISNKIAEEICRKHKKRQRKHKSAYSDEDIKIDASQLEGELKFKNDKLQRHNSKKEKRKDKLRESIDTDETRDEKNKLKKEKKLSINNFEITTSENIVSTIKKEGKMEDIFGPLSDESDRETRENLIQKSEYSSNEVESIFSINNSEFKLKEKDDNRRKKEKKRREKRHFKDDENSLDVDAVSKAIEARLFADVFDDDNSRVKVETLSESLNKIHHNDLKFIEANIINEIAKHDKLKKECKERRKKKKKSREDRQSRKDHSYYHEEKNDKIDLHDNRVAENVEIPAKTMLLDIPLPSDVDALNHIDKMEEHSLNHSLPRLTDSPPIVIQSDQNIDSSSLKTSNIIIEDDKINNIDSKEIEIEEIPMPPPYKTVLTTDVSEVPLPKEPIPIKLKPNQDDFISSFNSDGDLCKDAVRNITSLEKDIDKFEKTSESDISACKMEKKPEEKPRAIISQEETEDAVAALLGESFGGKANDFSNYDESENSSTQEIQIESTTIDNGNIPEEDAEEMRQAVQNLNASEMEIKPDTPVSDNDLLLIDTDTEEADETAQDSIEKLPVNIIATNQALNPVCEQSRTANNSNIVIPQTKPNLIQNVNTALATNESKSKEIIREGDVKIHLMKRENPVQLITSTATPVITSWTLSNQKLLKTPVLNIESNAVPNRENDSKPTHIASNIQIEAPQSQNIDIHNSTRPLMASTRVNASYQVINQIIRPQAPNIQPPTIKIPEPHILYQKPQSIVISPRMSNDPRVQSPKANPQNEGMTSPRLTNVAILSSSPQSLNSVGIVSPNAVQQRSPGQMKVVRMQQPPLSPIQAVHMPHGATKAMLSPNRPNSVLVQGAPIFNRLPVTPVLAPISKQMTVNNLIQQNKGITVSPSAILHQQKKLSVDCKKTESRNLLENSTDKIILSPANIQHNSTTMIQNRLISMQNAMHVGNLNSPVHLNNKVLINSVSQLNDKKDNQIQRSEQISNISFASTPIIHMAGVPNNVAASIIQTGTKTVTCNLPDMSVKINRSQSSNVIQSLNSQRIINQVPLNNILELETNKVPVSTKGPSVFSMTTIRPPFIAKLELSTSSSIPTTSISNVSSILPNPSTAIRLSPKVDKMDIEPQASVLLQNTTLESEPKAIEKIDINTLVTNEPDAKEKTEVVPKLSSVLNIAKCETDFEELLKDNTNEIKITNDPEKKLEVNIGKNRTLITPTNQNPIDNISIDCNKTETNIAVDSFKTHSQFHIKEEKDVPNNNSTQLCDSDNIQPNLDNTQTESISKKDNNNDADINSKDAKNGAKEIENLLKLDTADKDEECNFLVLSSNISESNDHQLKNDDGDSWSAKDVNIESVIKKVDSLCNENIETIQKFEEKNNELIDTEKVDLKIENTFINTPHIKQVPVKAQVENDVDSVPEILVSDQFLQNVNAKRGGRNIRGKKNDKNIDRVQTRQISKPSRGATTSKRGRGRAKVDKKIKSLVNSNASAMPGDVYDFHEDSGDEATTSPNKSEARPRLILTIKSPLSGHSNMIATSTLSIATKDHMKVTHDRNKEEKNEEFISPSQNTRKSRRLQEKDVQRNTVDDIIEDVIKGPGKINKESIKKKPTRQTGVKLSQDKIPGLDTRKSPRGVKRTRDRTMSDASLDSGDERLTKEGAKDPKIPRLDEQVVREPEPSPPPRSAPLPQLLPPTPTPITKPPKKMISEISAKLACAFEAAVATGVGERILPENTRTIVESPLLPVSTVQGGGEAALVRRLGDAVPGALVPVGATEATDARVQSPALPHRPPSVPCMASVHRAADRATPVLIRGVRARSPTAAAAAAQEDGVQPSGGRGEGEVAHAVGAGAGAAPVRQFRAYAATASLPRGAHHPPHPPIDHHLAKQVAVAGSQSQQHHPGAASRVTIASVPSISPQSQMPMGDGLYPHFSHQHYQMYQQHFRATQHENRATPSPYTRSLEAEGSEAPTPALELRRPPSTARVPVRGAHSPAAELVYRGGEPEPSDAYRRGGEGVVRRAPVAVYAVNCGRSPPPAHAAARLTGALPPGAAPGAPPGPPHASQVPREADSLQMLLRSRRKPSTLINPPPERGVAQTRVPAPDAALVVAAGGRSEDSPPPAIRPTPLERRPEVRRDEALGRYPVMWQGLLALKNDSAAVQMHFVGGNPGVAGDTLSRHGDGTTPLLRIAQRMRLEPVQLDQVHRKMKMENEHCMLLALPCGRDHMDVLQQSNNLTAGFIQYLQRKQAAGIVNVAPPGHHQAMYTVHIFPSCDFANENLNRIAPDLMHRVADIAHLLIVIATV